MKKYSNLLTENYNDDRYPLTCKIIDSEFIRKDYTISLDDIFYVLEIDFTDNKVVICKLLDEPSGYLKYYPKLNQISISPDIYITNKYNL